MIQKMSSTQNEEPQMRFLKSALEESMDVLADEHYKICLSTGEHLKKAQRKCVLIPAYHKYKFDIDTGVFKCISFSFSFLHEHTEHKSLLFSLPIMHTDKSMLEIQLNKVQFDNFSTLFKLFEEEINSKHEGFERICISLINIMLNLIYRIEKPNHLNLEKQHYTSLEITNKFLQLVHQNAIQHRGTAYYAQQLHLTPNYLNFVLKKTTGISATQHIYNYLISESKYLLIHTKLSSKEIAKMLGFFDQSYFTRFFKKHTGKNPLEWFNHQI